jgi:menaquinone-dependent protoporphyrinogen oxidase
VGERVLIAYASMCGSTAEIAQQTGRVLEEAGAEVHVCDVSEVTSLEGYTAVVLGTAIRLGKPVKSMRAFLRTHGQEVAGLPAAVFSVGSSAKEKTPAAICEAARAVAPVVAAVHPISIALFAGKVDHEQLALPWRALAEHSDAHSRLSEGDWRDWNAITSWARDLRVHLLSHLPAPLRGAG